MSYCEGWTHRKLGDVTENLDSRRVPVREADRVPGPYPYYGASGIVDHVNKYIFDGEYVLVAEDGENLRTRKTPIAFLVSGQFWVNNHAHILRGNQHADTRFLSYALARADISSYLTGSTMPKLTQGNLNRVPLLMPPLDEQRRIAHILGTLDGKIELNRKMNETLEEIARTLFTSWFVNFDPVRAKAEGREPFGMDAATAALFPDSFVDSELGPFPSGWEVGTIGDEFKMTMGQSPPGETYNTEGIGLPFYQGRADFGSRFPTRRVYCTAPTRFADPGDTLLSVRAPVGDINVASESCAIGRGVAALRHNSGSVGFTFQTMRQLRNQFEVFQGEGTVFGSINKQSLAGLRIIKAPAGVVSSFEKLVRPLDELIRSNTLQMQTLAEIRDTLLPKLLSGELRVLGTTEPGIE